MTSKPSKPETVSKPKPELSLAFFLAAAFWWMLIAGFTFMAFANALGFRPFVSQHDAEYTAKARIIDVLTNVWVIIVLSAMGWVAQFARRRRASREANANQIRL